jgi:LmbE family N-acetylglucosaminyl deacetylase
MFSSDSRVLVVAAHPDDEVLSMGGTLALAKKKGGIVKVHFLGEGVSARFEKEEFGSSSFENATKLRMDGAAKALQLLNVDEVIYGTRFCCRFDQQDILDLVKEVEKSILSFRPTHIFTHNPAEVNIDHRITFRVVETACRPTEPQIAPSIYGFEIPCSGNWTFEDTFKPNVYTDISPFWEIKLEAWYCYQGEDRPFPFPRSREGLKTLAQFRGMQSGLKKAEAFKLYRQIAY